ncbi:hypothetical protein OEZ86_006927 [Tetradesmus obliquus]|nr:hypothetical protein OEZ86_006927 [Tetradesmus obliquus]
MGHHHHKKGHGIVGHHAPHHALPSEAPPVPPDVYIGISFSPAAIIAATSRRCKLLGQGGCGRVFAADLPSTAAADTVPASNGSPAQGPPSTNSAQAASSATSNAANPTPKPSTSTSNVKTALLPKRVAVKTALPPAHGASWQHSRSLMAEARALRLAGHPAVIKVIGSCWSDELDALVFELLPALFTVLHRAQHTARQGLA